MTNIYVKSVERHGIIATKPGYNLIRGNIVLKYNVTQIHLHVV